MISPILLGLAGGDELRDNHTGKLAASSAEVDVALGGAWLVELALMQRIDVAGRDERVREGRLVARNPSPTGDGLLDEAMTLVGQRKGKNPQSVVARLGKWARIRRYERLVEGGVLRAEDYRVLGIFPTHRWPPKDAAYESSVRAGLGTALREGSTTEARPGALISLLLALNAVHKTVHTGSVGFSKQTSIPGQVVELRSPA